jgi:hypothetical protein
MDFANRGSRPTQQMPQQPAQMPGSSAPSQKNDKKKGLDFGKIGTVTLLFAGTLLAVALIIGLVVSDGSGSSSELVEQEQSLVQADKYQAIFLDSQDGQVYFGKMKVLNNDLYELTDIYYVRVEQPIQPEGANQQSQPNISLAKLGNELHGPQDVMYIARNKVLYWENLKDEGQVVTAIKEFKENGGSTNNNNQQTQQQTQPTGSQQQNAADQANQ